MTEIGDYLSQDSETYAEYIVDLVWENSKLLEQYPKLGKQVPEVNHPNFRELIIKNYRIIYSVPNNNRVDILAIRHSSQR